MAHDPYHSLARLAADAAGLRGGPAKEPRLWSRVPGQPGKRQVRQLCKIDGRTQLGRLIREFRDELYAHLSGQPNAVERALIDQCCALRAKTALLDKQILEGTATEMDANCYIAWANALRRALAALNYGEVANIIRKNAEAKLLREYSR